MRAGNFLLILSVSVALAGYSAWVHREGERSREPGRTVDAPGVLPLIRLAEARRLWQDPQTIFLDVRSRSDYAAGHIPGALHLPDEDFEQRFPALASRLKSAAVIVVYCKSTDCGKSLWTAIRLRNQGLMQTKIYPEGWNEWFNQGLPVERGP